MDYGFDTVINRFGTDSLKYDFFDKFGYPPDTLSMWVADMDFPTPPEVRMRLEELARFGVFGYSNISDRYFEAVRGWFSSRHGLCLSREWLVMTPGVVFAIAAAIRAFTKPGDGVLIQRPVYYPFERLTISNDRRPVSSPLVYSGGRYSVDFDDFEDKLVRENIKLFILCNPHNPVGRVWSAEELSRIGVLCARHGVLVVADEIHCDFIYPGKRFVSFGSLGGEFLQNSVICTAPSKTFNLAGLQLANIFIAKPELRERFRAEISRTGYDEPNLCGLAACEAAYTYGAPWLDALTEYLRGNLGFVRSSLAEQLPAVKLIEPEGTFLLWLDFSGLELDDAEINSMLKNKARLWLDAGTIFGPEGRGFQRINIACPRATLEQAMDRLVETFG